MEELKDALLKGNCEKFSFPEKKIEGLTRRQRGKLECEIDLLFKIIESLDTTLAIIKSLAVSAKELYKYGDSE